MRRGLYGLICVAGGAGIVACGGDDTQIDIQLKDASAIDAIADAAPGMLDAMPGKPDAQPVADASRGDGAPDPVGMEAGSPDAMTPPSDASVDASVDASSCPQTLCSDGPGQYCGDDATIITCTRDEDGCVVDEDDEVTCNPGEVCQGTHGEAQCLCPVMGTVAQGQGCSQLNSRECSADNAAVLKCVIVGGCMVWDDGSLLPDGPEPGDNCARSGLSCQNKQCVCPSNVSSDFYVNGNSLVTAKRNRPQLTQNGLQHPAICSFESVTAGLQNALVQRGLGQSNRSRVILDNCDDPLPLGTDTCAPVVFDQNGTSQVGENGPLHVPAKVEVLTVEHPEVGGTGSFHPDDFFVVMNNFSLPNPDGLTAAWTVSDSGRIAGFTIIEGGCDVDGDNVSAEYCADRYSNWPNVMVQLLDYDGFRFHPGNPSEAGRNEPRVEHMSISGAGGPVIDPNVASTVGGAFDVGNDGIVLFTPDDDEILSVVAELLDDGPDADSVFLGFFDASGPAGNYGAFGPVVTVDENGDPTTSNDAVAFRFYNPNGVNATYTGAFVVNRVGDIDVGLMVGRDQLNNFDYGGPRNALFGDTNASIIDIAVSHFASSWGNGGHNWPNDGGNAEDPEQGPPRQYLFVNRGRIGVLVDDDFPGSPTSLGQPADRVMFNGGLLRVNDTGAAVTDGHVIFSPLLGEGSLPGGGNLPFEIDSSTGQGLEIFDPVQTQFGYTTANDNGGGNGSNHSFADTDSHESTSVVANEILVHHTQWALFFQSPLSPDYIGINGGDGDDLNGNGINVTGDGTQTTFFDLDHDAVEDAQDCFEPLDVDCASSEAVVYTMNGGGCFSNDNDGLAILTIDPAVDDRQLVIATGVSFLNNGFYGVSVGNCADKDGAICHTTRVYDADVTLDTCTQANNGVGGLFVEENAADATTTISGGF
jgi:hypothetical protein